MPDNSSDSQWILFLSPFIIVQIRWIGSCGAGNENQGLLILMEVLEFYPCEHLRSKLEIFENFSLSPSLK